VGGIFRLLFVTTVNVVTFALLIFDRSNFILSSYLYVIFGMAIAIHILQILLYPLHLNGEQPHVWRCAICNKKGAPSD
jgi:hypothetical protein